jgi:hypothetical protein
MPGSTIPLDVIYNAVAKTGEGLQRSGRRGTDEDRETA